MNWVTVRKLVRFLPLPSYVSTTVYPIVALETYNYGFISDLAWDWVRLTAHFSADPVNLSHPRGVWSRQRKSEVLTEGYGYVGLLIVWCCSWDGSGGQRVSSFLYTTMCSISKLAAWTHEICPRMPLHDVSVDSASSFSCKEGDKRNENRHLLGPRYYLPGLAFHTMPLLWTSSFTPLLRDGPLPNYTCDYTYFKSPRARVSQLHIFHLCMPCSAHAGETSRLLC